MFIKQTLHLASRILFLLAFMSTVTIGVAANVSAVDPCKTTTTVLPVQCGSGSGPAANPIWGILLLVITIMTAGVGLLAVGGLVYGAILYTTAQNNSGQITKAKETIANVIIGLILFAFMWSLLQFLIPGGVFK